MNTQAFTRRWHKTPATTASSRSNGGGNGTGGTAADFRTAAASITETADVLATLAVLLENVAVALDDDNASAALAKLQQLPAAYQHAARELSQVGSGCTRSPTCSARLSTRPPRACTRRRPQGNPR
jgi:hypothetical protein